MTKKIVSACLAGVHCRFDCASKEVQEIRLMVENGEAIAVCPEELGGLSTPRPPAEKVGDKILTIHGEDVTRAYDLGAQIATEIALKNDCTEALLKSKSPMCGVDEIYDGSFSKKLVKSDGVFTKLLRSLNITVKKID